MGHLKHFEWHTVCHVSNIKLSQVELKVGPMMTHGMRPLDKKVKLMRRRDIIGIMGKFK